MNAGATADRVYNTLKALLLSGELPPGERLEPARFAEELSSSVTPVRDVLNRLVGEGLVDTRSGEGFHLPHVTEPALHDLYAWHGQLVRAALRLGRAPPDDIRADDLSADVTVATLAFFDRIGTRTRNVEAAQTLARAGERLHPARVAERIVLRDLVLELRELATIFDHEDGNVLARRLGAYHRRRLSMVPRIVRAMYRRD